MNTEQKLEMILKYSEKDFTKKFLIPLYKEMGFENLKYNHGVLEYGKDVIYSKTDEYGNKKYVGVQVKKGAIDTEIADKIFNQIARGFGKPFTDLLDNNKEKQIDEIIVLTSGDIKENARENISASLNGSIHKPVSFITGVKVVELLDKHMPSVFWEEYDNFKRYFNAMRKDFEKINDVSAIGQKEPISLEDIYVSLKVKEKIQENEFFTKNEQETSEDNGITKFIERERIFDSGKAFKEINRLVIVGVPGSGKSTLLKHFALKFCKENLENQERVFVPILIILRQLLGSGKNLEEYINEVFEKYDFQDAKDFIEKDLQEGKCVLLLDGFDELATKENLDKVVLLIQEFSKKYHKNKFIVTSRIAGYHDELNSFTKLELMEFNDEQIEKFIYNWFGKTDIQKAKSMFDCIKENEQIKALAHNPLMISIIAIIYEEDKELPQKRAALYERCIEVLLSKRDKQKKIKNKYSAEKKQFILKKLAFNLHNSNKRVMN
ncbi:NACHT domain-containing protein, partial [Candidatus Desantisbacteria bacterium]|nr:NACHT domain-containing protein [Candidatus Desantisbacteria bacterium]